MLVEQVYNRELLDKIWVWVKVCNQTTSHELHQAINSLLIDLLRVANRFSYFNFKIEVVRISLALNSGKSYK